MISNFSIVQCIFNQGKYSPEEMRTILADAELDESSAAQLLADDAVDISPIRTAVLKATGDELASVSDHYAAYVELFLNSLKKMLHTEAVVESVPCKEEEDVPSYATAQRISGDITIAAGIIASEPVYLKLAERYSEEELPEMDEMARDSMEEYINVLNGMFSVELGEQKIETDLELPRFGENVIVKGSDLLRLKVHSSVGSFQVVMATEDFF
ncbi:Chemotaxis protein CheX, a CheY~P-specific phosphatase [Selenomonas ruminantium]|uniref:Chemotaxis protein CheX, a CheY~P-specific phosphatase n=1 Tax=Selenomonas ruminantium TaxID=971 RepID=A0A1M6T569_SELRU|nr:chemotaxis protein CheX [Selenomonas ruminantium]SHK52107.1 Chemotaxis protein CheX, a CheY~P-specific phosphatase [Selenomonas ruminantium]